MPCKCLENLVIPTPGKNSCQRQCFRQINDSQEQLFVKTFFHSSPNFPCELDFIFCTFCRDQILYIKRGVNAMCYQFLCLFQACYPISCLLGRTVSVYLLPRHSCRQALNLGRKSKATKESTSKHSPLFTKMRKNVCFVKNDLQNSPSYLGIFFL